MALGLKSILFLFQSDTSFPSLPFTSTRISSSTFCGVGLLVKQREKKKTTHTRENFPESLDRFLYLVGSIYSVFPTIKLWRTRLRYHHKLRVFTSITCFIHMISICFKSTIIKCENFPEMAHEGGTWLENSPLSFSKPKTSWTELTSFRLSIAEKLRKQKIKYKI